MLRPQVIEDFWNLNFRVRPARVNIVVVTVICVAPFLINSFTDSSKVGALNSL
jgi:hypothetical protein